MFLAVVVAAHVSVTHGISTDLRPRHSWNTLPVFFHSANTSGPWSDAAAKQIARFAMATNEKNHAMPLPGGGTQSEEVAGPAACRQVKAKDSTTDTFFYLNSVIDWPFNYNLHKLMQENPSWRLKNASGGDVAVIGSNWGYNLTNDDMRAAWVAECVNAAKAGCTGCFIDQANVAESVPGWPRGSPTVAAYSAAHLAALAQLAEELAKTDGYAIFNHLGVSTYNTRAMMIEDFVGSEKCINVLQTIASRGLTIQAHAGDQPPENQCLHGDTNSLAAFLIGAGNYSYYHCSAAQTRWSSNPAWPAQPDSWLDWLPEYDMPLGAPTGPATQQPSPSSPSAHLWTRSFASGTRVEFDGGTANGTIWWAHGVVQSGSPANLTAVANGCKWESI